MFKETDSTTNSKTNDQIKIFALGLLLLLAGLGVTMLPLPDTVSTSVASISHLALLITLGSLFLLWFLWRRTLGKFFSSKNRTFIEMIGALIVVNLLASLTGGLYSYFSFLYFLPVFYSASTMRLSYSIAVSAFASVVISLHLLNAEGEFFNSLSVLVLYLFGLWLVSSLGRSLATQIELIKARQEEVQIEQLRQLDKIKDEFVFVIAHELRSPITAIRGYLELIKTDPGLKLNETLIKLLHKSFATSTKLANLVSLLLEVARLETGKIRFYFQKVDLRDVVEFVLITLESDRREKDIQITVEVEREIFVLTDKDRLEEILNIVVSNAIEFTPEFGRIVISCRSNEREIILSVSDTGIGINEERRAKLFEKYYSEETQLNGERVKSYGISLYAAKQLLLLMNADITCESIVGKGSTFSIKLPRYVGVEVDDVDKKPQTASLKYS